jgi:Phage integrase family/Phage integrase, N-terminal SAM-like domain
MTKTKADAWANSRLREILAQGERKLAVKKEVQQTKPTVTLRAFGPRYVVEDLKADRHKPRTVEEYENILDFYLYPRFGNRPLDSLTLPDIQRLKGGNLHILRHTFCSRLAMLGVPAKAIQELAGHQSLTTTQRYMHLSPHTPASCAAISSARLAG